MIVVPVLMTSCQVSLKSKNGPVIAQTTIVPRARTNAIVLPVQSVTARANFSVQDSDFIVGAFAAELISPAWIQAHLAPNGLFHRCAYATFVSACRCTLR